MTAIVPHLFKGIAVVIDNGIGKEDAIDQILASIKAGGGHAIGLTERPATDYDLEHFSHVSFFIMDWNLANDGGEPLEAGIRLPGGLHEAMVADNIAFLKRLSKNRHAPVFIFTNEDPGDVIHELSTDPTLHKSVQESHILVRRKVDVTDKLYEVLEDWARNTPSVLTLKTWEKNYLRAANDLFIDLQNRTPYWPVLLWQTFGEDGVPPNVEMNRLLNRLVESRSELLDLDLAPFLEVVEEQRKKDEDSYRASMHKVLEGERFLRDERLQEGLYAPGDVFAFPVQEGKMSFYVNVRAECDCLRGSNDMQLYLLQAKRVDDVESKIDHKFGTFTSEKDGEAIIFAMMDGDTYSIKFKDMKIKTLKVMKKEEAVRVGRLLPPFITRVQQRYASYVQRPGMPRIPSALYAAKEEQVA
ncbi:hypothetical protein HNO88_002556 [Novosphingobium chloroacetimidivorans]|uniref:Response receiver domain-containing protein n=1 Tax=Novosphingobium chloroacetimidivorans TaxID=1428314 RepID=A0A7W7KAH5_9SPHN|nr:hypothetical protein [Novosphingobium chloroacetimidivorans]MBB4859227.1 hypothetical protein [Novosphingobium chloroacetimidivorans]